MENKRWRSWTMSKIFYSVKIKMFTSIDEKNGEVVENFRHCRTPRIKRVILRMKTGRIEKLDIEIFPFYED